jgi:serine/threonine protein kinase
MPIELNTASKNLPIYKASDNVNGANTELHKLSAHIAARARGSIWPGYLKLVADPQSNTMSVERNRWFSGKSKPSAQDNQATSAYVRDLFRVSYGSRCSPAQYEKIMQEFENYLDDKNDKLGSNKFLHFVRSFDAAVEQHKAQNPVAFTANPIPADVAADLSASMGDHAQTPESVDRSLKSGMQSLFNAEPKMVKLLGSGAEGAAYSVWADGKPMVYKAFSRHDAITLDTLRKGEVGAARLKNASGVATPSDLLVKRNDGMVYRVPANEIKTFARQQLARPGTQLNLIGSIMPRAVGKPLDALVDKTKCLNDADFAAFSKSIFEGVNQMHQQKGVHHDIKPANVLFDPESGSATLIDMGGLDKLSKKPDGPQQSSRFVGTQFFFHPKFEAVGLDGNKYIANQHGKEVDRYALGLTLLCALEPAVNDLDFRNLAMSNVIPPGTPPHQYLQKNLDLLAKYAPDGHARLMERFAQNPSIQPLLQDVFSSSEEGPAAEALWDGIKNNPMFTALDAERGQIQQSFVQTKASLTNALLVPTTEASAYVASPTKVEVSQGKFLPKEGFFRAGKAAREDIGRELQKDVNKLSEAASDATLSSWTVLSNYENDPDLKQLRLDIGRAEYRTNNQPVLQNQGTPVERIKALKSAVGEMLEGQPDLAMQSDFANKAFTELAGILHQGTTLTVFGNTAVAYLNGQEDTKKPWHGALFDHPNFNIKPDTEQPGSLIIESTGAQNAAIVFMNNQQYMLGKERGAGADFTEKMQLSLRYTPSRDLTQSGTIECLDLQAQFANI